MVARLKCAGKMPIPLSDVRSLVEDFHFRVGRGATTYVAVVETELGCKLAMGVDLEALEGLVKSMPHTRYWIDSVVTCN